MTVPFTSSAVLGFVFPIPTLPSFLIRTLSAGGEPCASLVENAKSPLIGLTFNWDEKDYDGGRNFGHLAFEVDDIYAVCNRLLQNKIIINRPPRDGRMAFVQSPDQISIELLQKGKPLPIISPWKEMLNQGTW